VREEKLIPLQEAIRRLTSLPARNLKLRHRGALKTEYYADIVIFDPDAIQDHATYEEPHQLATGVVHVFINGIQVLRDGEHTGKSPGRVVRGPGWVGWHEKGKPGGVPPQQQAVKSSKSGSLEMTDWAD
jgi:N-acyl-D-amino-acid deacylase